MSNGTTLPLHTVLNEGKDARIRSIVHGLLWCLIAVGAYWNYSSKMDIYERGIGIGAFIGVLVLALRWSTLSLAGLVAVAGSLIGQQLYQGQLGNSEHRFWLKYALSSQAAVTWMSMGVFLAWGSYSLGNRLRSSFCWKAGNAFAWSAVTLGLTALLVRWYESYLYGSDIGHIPISNLYEVLVVFFLFTTSIYLYFESRYQRFELGAWAMGVMSAWIVFLLWYGMTRQAQEIQPLVPALQSYWMKIHVPANFIGYGGFTVAAMTGIAVLVGQRRGQFVIAESVLIEWMYRSIAVGFAFFTIATILGAIWAAEAWGGYWSWDPKEVWALVVWLNYAAWLHFRLTKGNQSTVLAVWSVVGFFITLFAFLGVNIFLSGLHSYGKL